MALALVRNIHATPKTPWPKVDRNTERPFRIWNVHENKPAPWRCYMREYSAHEAMAKIMLWAHTGEIYVVYHGVSGRELGVYKRGVEGMTITGVSYAKIKRP